MKKSREVNEAVNFRAEADRIAEESTRRIAPLVYEILTMEGIADDLEARAKRIRAEARYLKATIAPVVFADGSVEAVKVPTACAYIDWFMANYDAIFSSFGEKITKEVFDSIAKRWAVSVRVTDEIHAGIRSQNEYLAFKTLRDMGFEEKLKPQFPWKIDSRSLTAAMKKIRSSSGLDDSLRELFSVNEYETVSIRTVAPLGDREKGGENQNSKNE